MSLRERHLWIAIVTTVAVWGLYGWQMALQIGAGGLNREEFAGEMGGLFLLGLLLIAVAEGVLTLIARLLPRGETREGAAERKASLQASHVSLMALIGLITVLSAVLFCAGWIGSAAVGPLLRVATPANLLVLIANGLMGCIVVSELIRFAMTLALLRARR
ncbi:hypothetical protein GCM10017620_19840 [Brevundimonas intermedia]|uniref:DUF4149 domain-containing protein n=1 Tax=Brevundimonas intermedia TaxID=74315 RepID=A0ABQ5T8T8_9CAUL|nr:hypothetical protein [Brevundimonas intermedia]GLK49011.1 hypothetical protein GCM10017620_19840 [Brevundimonas intermedia]